MTSTITILSTAFEGATATIVLGVAGGDPVENVDLSLRAVGADIASFSAAGAASWFFAENRAGNTVSLSGFSLVPAAAGVTLATVTLQLAYISNDAAVTLSGIYGQGSVIEPLSAPLVDDTPPDPQVNEAPVFFTVMPQTIPSVEDGSVGAVDGILSATDPDGDALLYGIADGRAVDEDIVRTGNFGTLTLAPETGEYAYTLDVDAPGIFVDLFTVSVTDGELSDSVALIFAGDAAVISEHDADGVFFIDPNGDGRLYDAGFITEDGGTITASDTQLYRAYAGALGRTPDDSGFEWWSGQIQKGSHTLVSMISGFLWSNEFRGFFDDVARPEHIAADDFITHMYVNVFGREPDPGGFAFWVNELESGNRNQARVVLDMTQSNEFIGLTVVDTVDYLLS